MNILVTGGMGFIGSHLTERLLMDGHQVHVVDNLSTSPLPLDVLLAEMERPGNLTYDLMPLELYFYRWAERAFPIRFDQIYHLASPVGPAGILEHAGHMVKTVVDHADSLLEMLGEIGGRLLDVSTSEVYGGRGGGIKISETDARIIQANTTVRLEYAVAKLAAETMILNSCAVEGLDAVIVRPFNVAGPRQSPKGGFVVPRFVQQAMSSERLTIFGNGLQIRAFTHVADIVDGLILAMNLGRRGEVYNLGNPANRINIGDLARIVVDTIPGSCGFDYVDPKKIFGPLYAEAEDKAPDDTKATIEFGWMPKYTVADIVRDVWEYEKARQAVS